MPLLFVSPNDFVDSPRFARQPVHPSYYSPRSNASRESNYWQDLAERLEEQASVARENEAHARIRGIREQQAALRERQRAQAYFNPRRYGGACGLQSFSSPFASRPHPHPHPHCDCHQSAEESPFPSYEQQLRDERNARVARAAKEARERHQEKQKQQEGHRQGLEAFLRAFSQREEDQEVQNPQKNKDVKGKQRVPIVDPSSSRRAPTTSPAVDDNASMEVEVDQSRSLNTLNGIEKDFLSVKSNFVFPEHIDFASDSDSVSIEGTSTDRASVPPLLYTPVNNTLHAYEHSLNSLMGKLDEVESGGLDVIRERRKSLVRQVEQELEDLDLKKVNAWESSKRTSTVDVESDVGTVEETPEVVMGEPEEERVLPEESPMDVAESAVEVEGVHDDSTVVDLQDSVATIVPVATRKEHETELEAHPIGYHMDSPQVNSEAEIQVEDVSTFAPVIDVPSTVIVPVVPSEELAVEVEQPSEPAVVEVDPSVHVSKPESTPTEYDHESDEEGLKDFAVVEEEEDVEVESELGLKSEKMNLVTLPHFEASDMEDFEML